MCALAKHILNAGCWASSVHVDTPALECQPFLSPRICSMPENGFPLQRRPVQTRCFMLQRLAAILQYFSWHNRYLLFQHCLVHHHKKILVCLVCIPRICPKPYCLFKHLFYACKTTGFLCRTLPQAETTIRSDDQQRVARKCHKTKRHYVLRKG